MKRRDAIKNLGFAAGFVVVTPMALSILKSCSAPIENWSPKFLDTDHAKILTKLVDVFLPKTETLSATEAKVPQFIDQYIADVFSKENQNTFKVVFQKLSIDIQEQEGKSQDKLTLSNFKSFLNKNMRAEKSLENIAENKSETFSTSEFLNLLKIMTIQAYLLNEEVGKHILAYEPVPGAYYCGDLQQLTDGKSWSLDDTI